MSDPFVSAHAYLGELYLDMKDVKKARERLMFSRTPGGTFAEFRELKEKIEKFKS